MKTQFNLFILLIISSLFVLSNSSVYAQTEKVDEAVQKLLGTKFMGKFLEMRERAESAVSEFKGNQAKYQGGTSRVEEAYKEISTEFNDVLLSIKGDLLNKKKRKFIAKFPDSYAKGLEADLYRLSENYDATFRQALLDATDGEIDGIPLIPLLIQLFTITDEFAALIGDLRKYGRKFNDQHLTEKFYIPNQFKSWEAIETGRSAITNTNTTNENNGWNEPTNNTTNENNGWNEPTNNTTNENNNWDEPTNNATNENNVLDEPNSMNDNGQQNEKMDAVNGMEETPIEAVPTENPSPQNSTATGDE